MINKATLEGRLVRDPELRRIASGAACTTFRLAVEEDYTPENKQKVTDFFDCVAWRELGEEIAKNYRKGRRVIASGRLKNRAWTDRNGSKHVVTELVVTEIQPYVPQPKPEPRERPKDEDYAIHDEDAKLPWEDDDED